MWWVDAHAHLADLPDQRLDTVIAAARDDGVAWVANTATDLLSSRRVLEQFRKYPVLRPVVGISPFDAGREPADWHARLAELASDPGVVAIGETGLDVTNPRYPSMERQLTLFEGHVALALQTGLPLVVHSRGAERELAERCRALGAVRVVFHCFTGDTASLEAILANGYLVSFSGIVTYPSAAIARLVPLVPLDRLLIETDTPYLSPVPYRGRPNEPGRVRLVGERVAVLRDMAAADLAAAVRSTAERFFVRQGPW